jgi:hypothetical protein
MYRRDLLVCVLLATTIGCHRPSERLQEGRSDTNVAIPVGADEPVRPAAPAPADADAMVTVVCETKYYTVGWVRGKDVRLFTAEDSDRMWSVDGIVLEVVRPAEYPGQVITMHHDGVLASGDPYKVFAMGKRYEFRVSKDCIGRFDFRLCSIDGRRKQVPE